MAESETGERNRYIVGYALPTRKLSRFMTPHLINHAKHQQAAIDFVKIDISKPLTQQSPFDCILHKINTNDWKLNLHDYTLKNPTTVIIDPPFNIQRLHNRISMLEFIPNQLKIPNLNIPNQLMLQDDTSSLPPELKFPVIAKPLVADGSTKSHKMSLVLNQQGLTKLDLQESPLVLQQFVNHGGVIFKVYVAGDYVVRGSLADISDEMLKKMSLESSEEEGVLCFSQISNSAMAAAGDEEVEMPGTEFVGDVAKGMREVLGLHLFNFDMVRDDHGHYSVIDINYFPGYEKLPSYETVITDFLLDIIMKSR